MSGDKIPPFLKRQVWPITEHLGPEKRLRWLYAQLGEAFAVWNTDTRYTDGYLIVEHMDQ